MENLERLRRGGATHLFSPEILFGGCGRIPSLLRT